MKIPTKDMNMYKVSKSDLVSKENGSFAHHSEIAVDPIVISGDDAKRSQSIPRAVQSSEKEQEQESMVDQKFDDPMTALISGLTKMTDEIHKATELLKEIINRLL